MKTLLKIIALSILMASCMDPKTDKYKLIADAYDENGYSHMVFCDSIKMIQSDKHAILYVDGAKNEIYSSRISIRTNR